MFNFRYPFLQLLHSVNLYINFLTFCVQDYKKEKIRVVKMYYELGSIQKAIQKLGYPKRRNMVYKWIEEYKKTGRIKDKRSSHDIKQYTEEEKAFAVRFYHENHGSYQNVANELGYPSAAQLRLWVERAEKDCKITPHMIEYTKENFIKAAVEFCTDESGIVSISNKYHIAPGTIKKQQPFYSVRSMSNE